MLHEPSDTAQAIVIATGSEVGIAMEAAQELTQAGVPTRVVSMPSTNAFDSQDAAYKESVLPANITARLAVEAGATDGWYKYVGLNGDVMGMETFGESGPGAHVFEHFGFTAENVANKVRALVAKA